MASADVLSQIQSTIEALVQAKLAILSDNDVGARHSLAEAHRYLFGAVFALGWRGRAIAARMANSR